MKCPAWADGQHLHEKTSRSSHDGRKLMPDVTGHYIPVVGLVSTVEEKVCACGDVVGRSYAVAPIAPENPLVERLRDLRFTRITVGVIIDLMAMVEEARTTEAGKDPEVVQMLRNYLGSSVVR